MSSDTESNVSVRQSNVSIGEDVAKILARTRCGSFQCLAILFFNHEYSNQSYEELPGVEKDRIELTELLSDYQQIPIKNADNVLQELQYIIEEKKEEIFERVHFHFSGNYF